MYMLGVHEEKKNLKKIRKCTCTCISDPVVFLREREGGREGEKKPWLVSYSEDWYILGRL